MQVAFIKSNLTDFRVLRQASTLSEAVDAKLIAAPMKSLRSFDPHSPRLDEPRETYIVDCDIQ